MTLAAETTIDWAAIASSGFAYALRGLAVLVALALAWLLAGVIRRLVRANAERAKLDATLAKFAANAARWVLLILVGLGCLEVFGVHATSFAAVIGAAGLAVGLAFQGSLSNLAAGVMLLIFRPFKVGDLISVGGNVGTVNEIDLFITELDTPDGRRLILPNGSIFGSTIENISHHPRRRAEVDVGVAYAADLERTREVLLAAAQAAQGVLKDPAPEVVLRGLGPSSVDWRVMGWASRETFGDVRQSMVREVKRALDEARLEIPYPTQAVVYRGEPPRA